MKKILLLTLFIAINCFADITVPTLTEPVMDQMGLLDAQSKTDLSNQIRTVYNEGKGPQLTVLIIPTLDGDVVENVAHKVFTTWKLGDAKRDDGVLFIMAINDRKMRIEVGQGLEGSLTDYTSKHILGNVKPYFKSQDYASGIKVGVSGILEVISATDAVQMPVASTPEVQAPAKQPMTQAEKDQLLGMMFVCAIGLGAVLVLWRLKRGYSNRSEKLASSKRHKEEEQFREKEYKFKYKVTDLNKSALEYQKEAEEMKRKALALRDDINNQTNIKKNSPQAIMERKLHVLHSEQNRLSSVENDIEYYKKLLRENK